MDQKRENRTITRLTRELELSCQVLPYVENSIESLLRSLCVVDHVNLADELPARGRASVRCSGPSSITHIEQSLIAVGILSSGPFAQKRFCRFFDGVVAVSHAMLYDQPSVLTGQDGKSRQIGQAVQVDDTSIGRIDVSDSAENVG